MRSLNAVWVAAAVSLLAACGTPPAPLGPPGQGPPRGKSAAEYRRSLRPKRPADTVAANRMTAHVIDIGQGQSVLLEFPCGAILVDTGGEQNDAFDSTEALRIYLSQFFARRPDLDNTLSGLVISHPHIDHTRGIAVVRQNYAIENIVTNGQVEAEDDENGRPQAALQAWVLEANKREGRLQIGWASVAAASIPATGLHTDVIDSVQGCEASPVDPVITALWGRVEGRKDYSDNANDHSVALRVDFGRSSILITGDLEFEGLAAFTEKYRDQPALLDVDVYVVGHHGSKNATAAHLMRAMTPKVAVISAGPYQRNRPWTARAFGHPNVQAIAELQSNLHGVSWYRDSKQVWMGVKGAWEERPSEFDKQVINRAVYATGWDGTVDIDLYDNGWLEVHTEAGGS